MKCKLNKMTARKMGMQRGSSFKLLFLFELKISLN